MYDIYCTAVFCTASSSSGCRYCKLVLFEYLQSFLLMSSNSHFIPSDPDPEDQNLDLHLLIVDLVCLFFIKIALLVLRKKY